VWPEQPDPHSIERWTLNDLTEVWQSPRNGLSSKQVCPSMM
jgi:hypothetical protein